MNYKRFVVFLTLVTCLLLLPLLSYGITLPTENTIEQREVSIGDVADKPPQARNILLFKWLHMLDKNESGKIENHSVMAFGPQVPGDLARVLKSAGGDNGVSGLLNVIFRSILAIGVGFFLVFAVKRVTRRRIAQFEQITPPGNESLARLGASIIKSLPALLGLLLLAISTISAFLLIAGSITMEGRMLFQLIFGTVLIVLVCLLIGKIVFAPEDAAIRPLQLDDSLIKPLYRAFVTSVVMFFSAKLFVLFIKGLGGLNQTISWIVIILVSAFLAVLASLVLYLRKPVSNYLQTDLDPDNRNWFKEQLAAYWHIPALLYLLIVWFIWTGNEMAGTSTRDGSLILSLLIVPIYFVLSYAGQLIIKSVVDSLGLGEQTASDIKNVIVETVAEQEVDARKKVIVAKTSQVFRLLLVAILTAWTLSLWGYPIPYAAHGIRAIFRSFIVLALALVFWRFASSFIERKIAEATPEDDGEEDDDNEFGGGGPTGRSHTLLPMLRKVLGSLLVAMVMLIVISSLGVNITPLLAGAGVLGLAVGFGAQKLVSDVLSGFFFLLDDAFRIGEYIQAGKIRGTVEAITLRNVMLRHHLGMLQVVPHSDLGAVTNYMRGGIVIKFPLEFPYDTDIDKVRKIIKKVGQAMLKDEELGDDFILPVKSQGVYEITNSVMVIRVKFTAKPGKQFVIKREAFRRITEALNAKGIFYAHRKVIVDFPTDDPTTPVDEETRKKVLEAGAAAAVAVETDQQKPVKDEMKMD